MSYFWTNCLLVHQSTRSIAVSKAVSSLTFYVRECVFFNTCTAEIEPHYVPKILKGMCEKLNFMSSQVILYGIL